MKDEKNSKAAVKLLIVFLTVVMFFLFIFLVIAYLTMQTNYCSVSYTFNSAPIIFVNGLLYLFLAVTVWTISPIGIVFFGAARTLFSKSSSGLKRKVAWGVQGIAFLTWASLMFLLLIFYIDSISYQAFNLGGDILNLAIISGFAFFVVMILMTFFEKAECCKDGGECNKKENSDNVKESKAKPRKNGKCEGSIEFAGMEFGGIKRKVKNKIKEDLKKIIDKEINKRL